MNNGDMPAMPAIMENMVDAAGYRDGGLLGMTKREAFAMAAMQGLCANPSMTQGYNWQQYIRKTAWELADDMLDLQPRDVLTDQEEGK